MRKPKSSVDSRPRQASRARNHVPPPVSGLEDPAPSSPGRVTVKDVAARVGVSVMTVSRVINAPQTVTPLLRASVQQAIRSLGYIPNKAAAGLQATRNRIVGFLMPQLSVPAYHQIHVGLTDVLEPLGYNVLVVETRYDAIREAALSQMLIGWRPSGVVRVPTGAAETVSGAFRAAGIPVCQVAEPNDPSVDYGVGYPLDEMGRDVGRYLIERGRRHIAVVMPQAVPRFRLQFEGIRRAAEGRPDVRVDSLVLRAPSPLTMADGAAVMRDMAQRDDDVDALVFFNDTPAVGALLECQRLGIAVPERLAIMGYGDHEIASHIIPSLTSIDVDAREIGAACAKLLLERIDNPQLPRRFVQVGYRLVSRSSA